MNTDTELEVWRREWQSDSAVTSDLRRRVERQSRWMKIALAADVLVTVVIGGGVIWLNLRSPEPDMLVLAGMTWLFLAAAWLFALRSNRGNWSPCAWDTSSFINLSIRRCRQRLAAIRFGAGLFLCEIVFCLGWIRQHAPEPRKPLTSWLFFGSTGIDIVWLLTPVFFGLLLWYRRKKRSELAYLVKLCGEVDQVSGDQYHYS